MQISDDMLLERVEHWSFSRREAAEMLDMLDGQLANWLQRYRPFPGEHRGSGVSMSFDLRKLMQLLAIKEMVERGFAPEKAADAFRPYGSPYRCMVLDGWGYFGSQPGTMVLTTNHEGRWIGKDSADETVAIHVRSWPLFDTLWPKVKANILGDARGIDPEQLAAAVARYEKWIEEVREQRWARA